MKRTLVQLGLAVLITSALVGCSGGGDGSAGAPGTPGAQGPAGGGTSVAALTNDQWADLKLQGQVTKVTINSPPEVTFTLTDQSGNAIAGLENNKTTASGVTTYSNVQLSIAKLVPGTNNGPSKWVSYIVTTTAGAPTRPSLDNSGTLTYNGNGSYTYRFARDITTMAATVAAATVSAPNNKADLGDLSYQPTLTHRVGIQISGNARGTGNNTATGAVVAPAVLLKDPINIIYDFVPATGLPVTTANTQREIASVKACFECHTKFVGFHGSSPELGLAGIGASRQDTRMCVLCHTDQRGFGRRDAAVTATTIAKNASDTGTSTYRIAGKSLLDFPTFVHKIHMGEELVKTGYDIAGLKVNEVKFPQLITNCTKCHDGTAGATNVTAQGDNWNTVPNRAACGACHDGIDFATGTGTNLDGSTTGHGKSTGLGGVQLDDSQCKSCHGPAEIKLVHVSVTPIDPNNTLNGGNNANTNAAAIAANTDNLPTGAIKVTYDIKRVTRNASKQPEMVFRFLLDGVPATFNAPPAVGTSDAALSNLEMLPNFMGSPSAYFVFSVPQDGVAKPADFNASVSGYLRSIWNGKATTTGVGTFTGPLTGADAGYYRVTLTGVVIPDNAVMLSGGLGYSYAVVNTLPLTQTNLAAFPVLAATPAVGTTLPAFQPNKKGGLIVVAPDTQVVASTGCTVGVSNCTSAGAYIGRRVIVEDARCNKCHRELGVFNESSFHSGQRNDATTCSWCHTPNRTSSGWSADSTNFIHSIHAAGKRGDAAKFTWHATEPDPVGAPGVFDGFFKIGFPGVLSNCEACHVPGSYDFSNPTNRAAADNRLYRTAASGTPLSLTATPLQAFSTAKDLFSPPLITAGTNYGAGFSFNAATASQVTTQAAATTLVSSPTATVCFACHTTALAQSHMKSFGASIYEPRSTALDGSGNPAHPEQCLICHDAGRIADLRLVHSK